MLDRSRLVRVEQGAVVRELAWTGSTVRDLWIDEDGVYVATYGDGLVRLSEGAAPLALGLDQGLCDEMVSHLYPVEGQLWFNSNRGLGRVPIAELRAVVAGEREAVSCTLAGSAEGNGPFGSVDAEGRIWASTVSGLAWIDPAESLTSLMPRLRISRALHRGQPMADGARVQGQGALSFEYRGLLYSDPKAVRYRYRLVGLDEAWSSVSGVQRVDYPALKPGSYRFEVQARGLGSWGPVERLSFERLPMWWERPGLRVGIPGLALAGLLAGLLLLWRQNERLRGHIRERARAEAALARQQEENQRMVHEREIGRRLEALGRLAGGVAHDLNNLLTVIAVHAGLLESHSDPEVQEEGVALRDVVARGGEITRGLLAFGQERGEQAQIIDVGQEVERLILMLRRLIRSEVTLDLQVEPGCGAHISTGQLHQILSNLVLNARDAIDGDGVIRVRVRGSTSQVALVVQDSGVGMAPEALAQAVEPYFTTKAPNLGSGLGLSTVRSVLQELGGTLTLSAPPAGGVRVVVTLPRVDLPGATPGSAQSVSQAPLEIRLLIVEDRPEVLTAVSFLAKRLGCTTFTADGLQAAVALAEEQPLDLVLTDVMMPGGTGPEVIRALRAIQPELPALLMSGYADVDLDQAERLTMLRKPFTREQLREGILGALQG